MSKINKVMGGECRKSESEEIHNDYSKSIKIDDLCDQRLPAAALEAAKKVQFSIELYVSDGRLALRGKANIPLKPFLIMTSLIVAGNFNHLQGFLKSIFGPP